MKFLVLLFLITFSACNSEAQVNPQEAYQEVLDQKAIFVDVRELDEVKTGMIAKAIWLPLSKVKENDSWKKEFLASSFNKSIYVYCRSGKRAEIFRTTLQTDNIESINLGGFESLKALGLPTQVGP